MSQHGTQTRMPRPTTVKRKLGAPGIGMLRSYHPSWLRRDILAGATVFAVLVPSALAYGTLAGLAPVAGLYAALAAMAAYALFGSSRQLIIGPDAALPLLIAATITPLAAGDPQHYALLVATMSVVIGLMCIAAAFCRAGFVITFIPRPILTGYINGIALTVIASQLGKLLGLRLVSDTALGQFWEGMTRLGEAHWPTLAIGLVSVSLMLLARRATPRVPGPLIVMVGAMLVVGATGLEQVGVAVVGVIPAGFPRLIMPRINLDELQALLIPAATIALISFTDEVLTARSFGAKNNYEIDANQELIAVGAADIAAGLLGGFPVSASSARTAVVDSMDGKTQVAGLGACCLLILFLFFFTSVLATLPIVVLAAVLIVAVIGLIDITELRRLYGIRRSEFWLAAVTTSAVLVMGLLEAILIAVALAVVVVLGRIVRPHDAVLGTSEQVNVFSELRIDGDHHLHMTPGLIVYRFDAPLVFANAPFFLSRIRAAIAASEAPIDWLLIDAEAMVDLDTTAADMLMGLLAELEAQGIQIVIARASAPLYQMLSRTGLVERIGEQNFFHLLGSAVQAFHTRGANHAVGQPPTLRQVPRTMLA